MSKDKYTQNERKVKLLEEQIKTFKQAIKACEEIINRHTETSVLDKYNIDRRYFRHILFEPKLGFSTKEIPLPPNVDDDTYNDYWRHAWKDYCWEEKLFCDVFCEYNINYVPTHLEYVLPIVLDQLTTREKQVLIEIYMNGHNMNETAEIFGVTPNRIMQIRDKAKRKLRHPKYSHILKYGPDYALEMQKIREEDGNNRKKCEEEITRTRNEVNDLIRNNKKVELLRIRAQIDEFLANDTDVTEIDSTSNIADLYMIPNMGFTVRTRNALGRGGYKSILEFKGKTVQEVMKIRNLGRKSLDELARKLADYGIYLIDEDTNSRYIPPEE